MLATSIVNIARNHILPDATALQLYRRFGICRDQLAGSIKSLVALLIIAARRPVASGYNTATLRATITQLIGIAVGVHGMAYLHHSMDY